MGVSSFEKRINNANAKIQRAIAEQQYLEAEMAKCIKAHVDAKVKYKASLTAKDIVIAVALQTQYNIGERISEIVSLALSAIWENPYIFEVEFVQRRGHAEVDLFLNREGNRIDPLYNSGGGVIDVVSLALRFAVWALNHTGEVFILDEPFRNLHGNELNEKAGLMLKSLAEKLGIQVIMASADDYISQQADKVFIINEKGYKES